MTITTTFIRVSSGRYYIATDRNAAGSISHIREMTDLEKLYRAEHVRLSIGEEITCAVPEPEPVEQRWWIDTNAGPIDHFDGTDAQCRRYVERMIPLLSRRGYSHSWRRQGEWHIIECYSSTGRTVHSAAFRPEGAPVERRQHSAAEIDRPD
jgi:hypothetical protein